MTLPTLDTLNAKGKVILTRVDLNVPMQDGKVSDATRLEAIRPTILELSDKGGRVVLLAHFGRPKGTRNPDMSLKVVVAPLSEVLGRPVSFSEDCVGEVAKSAISQMKDGDILVLENTRYRKGEEKNDAALAKEMAAVGDVYVNDAFSAAHRAHVSTEGLAHLLPAYAGRSLEKEVTALEKALTTPQKPVAAIVGGAKVSTKIELLSNLITRVDMLLIGGGMANTFLAAQGHDVGKSLCEHDLKPLASEIMAKAEKAGCEIILPVDAAAAKEFKAHAEHRITTVEDIQPDEMMLDMGFESITRAKAKLSAAKTVVWNGPFGAFEIAPFDVGTNEVARFVAEETKAGNMLSVAGGGDTVAALNNADAAKDFSYVSTAGGAFLEWLEGKTLPGIAALLKKD